MGKPSSSAVALMLLVEVAYEMDPSVLSPFQSHIMFMIHVALIALDHDVFAIRDSAKFILVNLIHAVSFRGMPDADADSNRVNEVRCCLLTVRWPPADDWTHRMNTAGVSRGVVTLVA